MDGVMQWAMERGCGGVVERATGREALLRAYGFVHDRYVAAGYIAPSILGVRMRPWECQDTTLTWQRRGRQGIQGVLSLILSGNAGLPCDRLLPSLTRWARGLGPVGEASNLCVAEGIRGASRLRVVLELCAMAYEAAVEADLQWVLAAVSPGHVAMMQRMGFYLASGPLVYPQSYEMAGGMARGRAEDIVQIVAMETAATRGMYTEVRRSMPAEVGG